MLVIGAGVTGPGHVLGREGSAAGAEFVREHQQGVCRSLIGAVARSAVRQRGRATHEFFGERVEFLAEGRLEREGPVMPEWFGGRMMWGIRSGCVAD
ncbi:MAG TPA: hypothetical protein VHX38_20025 [Pseudonocardiaceae bacterium]|nr:hypothetical protein [Pseudonocardiaceae bacterium]